MAYLPYTSADAKAQLDYERARERTAATKAGSRKALSSRAATAATSSKPSSPTGVAGPSSASSYNLKQGPAWRRPSHPASPMSRPSPTRSARSSSRQLDFQLQFDDAAEEDHPELDGASDSDSASETEHEAVIESRMPTLYDSLIAQPLLARGEYHIPQSSAARRCSPFPDLVADSLVVVLPDYAAVTDRYYTSQGASPSPPKRDTSLSASSGMDRAQPLVERAYEGPGLGLNGDGHWYEAVDEEDGRACWTAYASHGPTNSVIVVRECRW